MTSSRAADLELLAGALSLDFANTAGGRTLAQPVEQLHTADDLVAWAAHAGVIRPSVARALTAEIARDVKTSSQWLRRALMLREAIHEIGTAIERGAAPAASHLDTVVKETRSALSSAALALTSENRYRPDFTGARGIDAVLGPIAWNAVEVLGHEPLDRLKTCPAVDCGWLFIDRSKGGTRRWCDMATCGNRAKARRHRKVTMQ